VGDQTLEQRFPHLFNVSVQQDNVIQDGVWRWHLRWRRRFFVWEEPLLQQLEDVINNVVLTEVDDKWMWTPNVEDDFSVKSLYEFL
jgi:hypothetical protein